MKFKKLHYISSCLLLLLVAILTQSNSTGITGRSLSGCDCHAAAASTATIISITGMPASYTAGATYNLTLTVTNTAKSAAGFDLTVNVGSLTATAANTVTSGPTELRHSTPKALISGTTSWTFNWTAPIIAATSVVFSTAANAVNLNGINDAGDIWNVNTLTIPATAITAPPVITLNAVTGITNTTATINGTVNANNAATTVSIEYGLSIAYGTTVVAAPATVSGTIVTPVSAALTGLLPNTTYHYHIKTAYAGGVTNSADGTFTTLNTFSAASVSIVGVSGITSVAGTINGTVNPNNSFTTVTVQYGLTTAYGTSLNAVPNVMTGVTGQPVTAALSGLTAGTLYHYRIVAVNGAGTTNSADSTFTTLSVPAAPSVTLQPVTAITSTGATVHAAVNANNSATTITVQYGPTTAYGSVINTTPNTMTGGIANPVTGAITGLTASTLYHYRIVAVNGIGTTNSADGTFTTLAPPVAPAVLLTAMTGITFTGATVNGTVNANGANATVTVEYGLTTAYGSLVNAVPNTVTGTAAVNVQAGLTGLTPNTLYHYRIVAANTAGTTRSADGSFTTLNNQVVPSVVLNPVSVITSSGATVNALVNAGNAATTVTIEYGLSTAYGSVLNASPNVVTGGTVTPVLAALTGLSPNTLYHYRVKAVNSLGAVYSSDDLFTTAPLGFPPAVILNGAGNFTGIGATIKGMVTANNANTTVRIEYGLTSAYGSSLNATPYNVTGAAATPVTATITSLQPGRIYHYRIKAANAFGTTYSTDDVFTTAGLSVSAPETAGFSIFPNPVQQKLIITAKTDEKIRLSVVSMNGSRTELNYTQAAEHQYTADMDQLPAGMYLLLLQTETAVYTVRCNKQ